MYLSFAEIDDIIVEGFVFILRELPQRPVLSMLFQQNADLVHHLTLEAEEFNRFGARFCATSYELASKAGRLRKGVSLGDYVEWSTGILISLASIPYLHQTDSIRMREALQRFLLPSLLTGL